MEINRSLFKDATENGLITEQQADQLWQFLSQQSKDTPSLPVADKDEPPITVKEPKTAVVTPIVRVQRSVRLPIDLCDALSDRAYAASKEKGVRVTEQELVEQALRKFLK